MLEIESELVCEGELRKDVCHRNLIKWNDGQCNRFFSPLSTNPANFVICGEDSEKPLTLEDILEWKAKNPD